MVISHSHYDHLCSRSVEDLRARFGEGGALAVAAKKAGAAGSKPLHWYVPLGMASWFHAAGVRSVTELDWWEEAEHGGVRVACTPAQHWSARTPFDKNTTLWSSWCARRVHLAAVNEGLAMRACADVDARFAFPAGRWWARSAASGSVRLCPRTMYCTLHAPLAHIRCRAPPVLAGGDTGCVAASIPLL